MPGQVIPVQIITTLGVTNTPNAMSNIIDTITLIASGNGVSKTEKSALVQVSNYRNQDSEKPYLDYQFTSTCVTVKSSSCESEIWTVEVKAQDKESGLTSTTWSYSTILLSLFSGLLQLGSNPIGINFATNYVSGTKELVTGHYSASCCDPYIEIFAIDVNNNRRSYKLDANCT